MDKNNKEELQPIECLDCGEIIELPKRITVIEKYHGQFRCNICKALLYVRKVGNEIQEYKLVEKGSHGLSPEDALAIIHAAEKEKRLSNSDFK